MSIFSFRQFKICDDRATMKVGTDAVLLGAWTNVNESKKILDIGTGSGVLAIMMAQKSLPDTIIDAVELLKEDSEQAIENIERSAWSTKIVVTNTRIQDFTPNYRYDLIICNPPFFLNSLLPPTEARSTARHNTTLTSDDLLESASRLLSSEGSLSIILPTLESELFVEKAFSQKLFLTRLMRFHTRIGKPQERSLMEFKYHQLPLQEESVTLYEKGNGWTDGYRDLTKDFYLEQTNT